MINYYVYSNSLLNKKMKNGKLGSNKKTLYLALVCTCIWALEMGHCNLLLQKNVKIFHKKIYWR
jgi:hypothetical protein